MIGLIDDVCPLVELDDDKVPLEVLERHTDDEGPPWLLLWAANVGHFRADVEGRTLVANAQTASTVLGLVHFASKDAWAVLDGLEGQVASLTGLQGWSWVLDTDYEPCPHHVI